ncbi:beta-xylosidase [Caballeronia sp. DA-9]|uniref:beta-xylosidase n=1 Tax=Caballeronia sp. DA-9 TaxID=3436237 RepID=UPI003F67C1EF
MEYFGNGQALFMHIALTLQFITLSMAYQAHDTFPFLNVNVRFRKRLRARMTAVFAGSVLFALSTYGFAQISQGNGSSSQDNRTSSAGTQPDASASTVHESLKPQSKEAAGNARGATAGNQHKTEGAGGFNNGLYGTGAGSNK